MTARFGIVENKQSHLVIEQDTGRCLGGVAINHYRPYVYPLYSPSGITVLQEAPPDHPFHSGLFVGQSPVLSGDRKCNFWATPPPRMADDPLQAGIGRMSVESPLSVQPHESGLRIQVSAIWRDENEDPVLDELRTVDFHLRDGATTCDMTSLKTASYGPVSFPATKHGSVGLRVEPRLLPDLGAEVIGDRDRRGRADVVHELESAYVAYENELAGRGRFGVLMAPLRDSASGTWFIRDYGMAMYDATLNAGTALGAGESWSVGLRVAAYDGALSDRRAQEWIAT